jgi:hypothetical protein
MPQTVIIAAPKNWGLAEFETILGRFESSLSATLSIFEEQIQLVEHNQEWHVVVTELDDRTGVAADYQSNSDLDDKFRENAQNLSFFCLRFNDFFVAKRIVFEIARTAVQSGADLWIDTDYGWVIHAWEFVARASRDPQWDWRMAVSE